MLVRLHSNSVSSLLPLISSLDSVLVEYAKNETCSVFKSLGECGEAKLETAICGKLKYIARIET